MINVVRDEVVAELCETMLTDTDAAARVSEQVHRENRTLWEKIRDWVKDKLSLLRDFYKSYEPDSYIAKQGREIINHNQALLDAWVKAAVSAVESYNAESRSGTAAGEVRNSVREDIVDVNGKEYDAVVQLDKKVSLRTLSSPKLMMRYIVDNFVGLRIPVLDEFGSTEIIEFAEQSDTVSKGKNRHPVLGELAYAKGDIKKKIIVNAKETISESVYDPVLSNGSNSHGWLDANGWESRITYVLADNGNIYEAFLKIGRAKDGRNIMYAVNVDANNGIAVDKGATRKRAAVIAAMPSADKVSQNASTVNPNERNFTRDSSGKELTEAQQEYFSNSKIRDKDGNLMVMYRGGREDFTVFDRKKSNPANLYGRGFYFTNSESHAKTYGNAKPFYLNITNPLMQDQHNITRKQMQNFIQAVADNEDDYGLENYGYGATVSSVLKSVWGKGDYEMIWDLNQTAIGDMVAAVELFNEVNGTDYDGLVMPQETVTFQSNQAKNIDNENPTDNPDIRFSMRDSTEETRDLVAVHNLSEDKLMKSLSLGGRGYYFMNSEAHARQYRNAKFF